MTIFVDTFERIMSHEFPEEELMECQRCGALLPRDLLIETEDGELLCEDCAEEG